MDNINKFCERNKLFFVDDAGIGFGRPCVGIYDGSCYVSYSYYDMDSDESTGHSVASEFAPSTAYHKGSYLAVLGHGPEAIKALDEWVGKILEADFEMVRIVEKGSLSALMGQRTPLIKDKVKNDLTDNLTYETIEK